jgi:uncharacterized membrane protein YoaK (UPF0700 family)
VSGEAESPMGWVLAPLVDNSRTVQALLIVLSVTAGCTDVIGFLVLNGLFTAHITGNLVILAAHIGGGGEAQIAPMLSVPVFIVMVGLTRLLAGGLESIGLASLRPLLLLQFLLLAGFLVPCVAAGPRIDPNADAVFLLAVYRASEICINIVSAGIVLAGTDFGGARRRLAALFAALSAEITGRFTGMLALAGLEMPETQPARRELVRRIIALDPVIDEAKGESSQLRYHSPVLTPKQYPEQPRRSPRRRAPKRSFISRLRPQSPRPRADISTSAARWEAQNSRTALSLWERSAAMAGPNA